MRRRRRDGNGADDRDDGRRLRGRRGPAEEDGLETGEEAAEVGAAPRAPLLRPGLRLCEALRQRAPRAEDEGLDRRLRQLQLRRDLAVGEALPFAQEDRAPLALRHLLEHVLEAYELVGKPARSRGKLLDALEARSRLEPLPAPGRPPPRAAAV